MPSTPLSWTVEPAVPAHAPQADYWKTLLVEDDPDPDFRTYHHLFAECRPWQRGCIDGLLREVADDEVADVLITDVQMERVYHPYDGGADVFLPTCGAGSVSCGARRRVGA